MVSSTNPAQNWKFQGQEFTENLEFNMYEFKYRMHDPAIGRFMQIDPLAEEYVYNSPYAFSENRVIDGVEIEGLEFAKYQEILKDGGKKVSEAAEKAVVNKTTGAAHRKMRTSQTTSGEERINIKNEERNTNREALSQFSEGVVDMAKGGTVVAGEGLKESGQVVEDMSLFLAPFTEGASLSFIPLAEGMKGTGSGMQMTVYLIDENYDALTDEALSFVTDKVIGQTTNKVSKAAENTVGKPAATFAEPFITNVVDWVTDIIFKF